MHLRILTEGWKGSRHQGPDFGPCSGVATVPGPQPHKWSRCPEAGNMPGMGSDGPCICRIQMVTFSLRRQTIEHGSSWFRDGGRASINHHGTGAIVANGRPCAGSRICPAAAKRRAAAISLAMSFSAQIQRALSPNTTALAKRNRGGLSAARSVCLDLDR